MYYYYAEDDTVYIVATEDIGPDTEIMVFYPQPTFWRLVDFEKKRERAAMTPEQLMIAKANDVIAKEVAKASKLALKTEAVKTAKAVKAAAKVAKKKTVKEAEAAK